MDSAVEKLILKHRQWCEMPGADGVPRCGNKATHVVEVMGKKWQFKLAVCDNCAVYARNHKPKWKTTKSAR
jgi:hypothetical protein